MVGFNIPAYDRLTPTSFITVTVVETRCYSAGMLNFLVADKFGNGTVLSVAEFNRDLFKGIDWGGVAVKGGIEYPVVKFGVCRNLVATGEVVGKKVVARQEDLFRR